MTGYSLSFFAIGRYDQEWWDTLTDATAAAAAAKAISAGCVPNEDSPIRCGFHTAWTGPGVGEVLAALKKVEVDGKS